MTPASIDTLIAAPIQTRGLPMRIAAVPVPTGAAPGTAIAVAVELRTSAVAGAGPIAFSLLAADFDGSLRLGVDHVHLRRAAVEMDVDHRLVRRADAGRLLGLKQSGERQAAADGAG